VASDLRLEGPDRRPPTTRELFDRFRALYDRQAEDQTTALGLFFERHQTTVRYQPAGNSPLPEYLEPEWKRVFDELLAAVAREFGLVPGTEWTGTPGMVWYWPSSPSEVAVLVQEAIVADETLLRREVPGLVADGAPLSFLIVYPDDPLPPDATDFVQSCETWRKDLEKALDDAQLAREFLVAMISAYSWEIPSSWIGFGWDSSSRRLVPL
jgi:hypothetical protein